MNRNSFVRFDSYVIGDGQLWKDGVVVHLTRTQYSVLEYFVGRPREVVSLADLHLAVWNRGQGTHVSNDAIYKTIDRVNMRLGAEYIETVRTRGYVFKTLTSPAFGGKRRRARDSWDRRHRGGLPEHHWCRRAEDKRQTAWLNKNVGPTTPTPLDDVTLPTEFQPKRLRDLWDRRHTDRVPPSGTYRRAEDQRRLA